jgi:hypothetical protein
VGCDARAGGSPCPGCRAGDAGRARDRSPELGPHSWPSSAPSSSTSSGTRGSPSGIGLQGPRGRRVREQASCYLGTRGAGGQHEVRQLDGIAEREGQVHEPQREPPAPAGLLLAQPEHERDEDQPDRAVRETGRRPSGGVVGRWAPGDMAARSSARRHLTLMTSRRAVWTRRPSHPRPRREGPMKRPGSSDERHVIAWLPVARHLHEVHG